jgi:glycerol uptake facilitator protein
MCRLSSLLAGCHIFLPNKGGSDWRYAWIPVAGPLIGGALGAGIYNLAFA